METKKPRKWGKVLLWGAIIIIIGLAIWAGVKMYKKFQNKKLLKEEADKVQAPKKSGPGYSPDPPVPASNPDIGKTLYAAKSGVRVLNSDFTPYKTAKEKEWLGPISAVSGNWYTVTATDGKKKYVARLAGQTYTAA